MRLKLRIQDRIFSIYFFEVDSQYNSQKKLWFLKQIWCCNSKLKTGQNSALEILNIED
jgi:hypothetical protein